MAKILFIEDNEGQLSIIKFLTLAYKHNITWVRDISSAILHINNFNFDYVILDIMMKTDENVIPTAYQNLNGKKTGLFILDKLRELNLDSKVIVLSARDDLQDQLREFKIIEYLVKPTSPHLINRLIEGS